MHLNIIAHNVTPKHMYVHPQGTKNVDGNWKEMQYFHFLFQKVKKSQGNINNELEIAKVNAISNARHK